MHNKIFLKIFLLIRMHRYTMSVLLSDDLLVQLSEEILYY